MNLKFVSHRVLQVGRVLAKDHYKAWDVSTFH